METYKYTHTRIHIYNFSDKRKKRKKCVVALKSKGDDLSRGGNGS